MTQCERVSAPPPKGSAPRPPAGASSRALRSHCKISICLSTRLMSILRFARNFSRPHTLTVCCCKLAFKCPAAMNKRLAVCFQLPGAERIHRLFGRERSEAFPSKMTAIGTHAGGAAGKHSVGKRPCSPRVSGQHVHFHSWNLKIHIKRLSGPI